MATRIPDLRTCRKIGFIVPSSNSVVEPTCNAIINSLNATTPDPANQILCLYTRIGVKTVGTDSSSTSQFSTSTLIQAAQLLADAECEAVFWNGTSGMWVGSDLAADEELAKAMTEATGVPCSTTTIATVQALREKNYKSISLAVPYTEALTQKLVDFFTSCGFDVLRAERLKRTPANNLEIGKCSPEDVKEVIVRARGGSQVPDAVVVACTNWAGAALVQGLEDSVPTQATVVDSTTVTVWHALRMIRWEGGARGWGELMEKL